MTPLIQSAVTAFCSVLESWGVSLPGSSEEEKTRRDRYHQAEGNWQIGVSVSAVGSPDTAQLGLSGLVLRVGLNFMEKNGKISAVRTFVKVEEAER